MNYLRNGWPWILSVVVVAVLLALSVKVACGSAPEGAPRPEVEAQVQAVLLRRPELGVHLLGVAYQPCATLFNNATRPDCATSSGPRAEAEADFATMTIRIASDLPVISAWVVEHELCHLYEWAVHADPSEEAAKRCEDRGQE